MKRILLFTLLSLMSWFQTYAQYCASEARLTAGDDITRVKLNGTIGTIDNKTACVSLTGSQGIANGIAGVYSNFTTDTLVPRPSLKRGITYSLTVNTKNCTTQGSSGIRIAYFDWNRNGSFDTGTSERIVIDSFPSSDTFKTISFTVPSNAVDGYTRMRIVYRLVPWLNSMNACGLSMNPGETEDYSVEIDDCHQFLGYVSNISHPKCFGQASGSISVNATGGTPPYTYNWSNGNKTIQNSNLLGGTYRITVSDKNGCTATMSSEIMEPMKLSLTIIRSSANSLEALPTGGTITAAIGYSYSWNNGQPSVSKITNLTKGFYCVTVSDANGCTIGRCDSIVGSGSSNINSIHQNFLSISPNPTQNIATIEVNLDKASSISYTLFNIQGKLIRQEELANKAIGNIKQEINLDGINPGIYILNISINGKETSLKVVKE
jgi:hypothetical protein